MAGFETLPDFEALTPESLEAVCRGAMAECDAALDAIASIPAAERTAANTLLAMEEAVQAPARASGMFAFMSYVSPVAPLREKARDMDAELDKYFVGLSFREDLYAALREFAATPEAAALEGEDARYLAFELRDFRRNGLELDSEKGAELRRIFDRLVEVGVAFRTAIDEWDDGLDLERSQLGGLPDSFIDGLRKTTGGDGSARYRVSLDYPELHPFMANADDAALRRDLFERDQRKGGPGNVALLEEALALRKEAAALLGYESWSSYVLEERMAKTPGAVEGFLADLRERLTVKGALDLEAMSALKTGHTGDGTVNIWDWRYYHNRAMRERYEVDEFAVAEYFPLEACLRGLFDATQALLGVRFERDETAPRWHPDVDAFDVFEAGATEPFARFYTDLFPRPAKYGHAAAFTLQRGRRLADGSYQPPISAIVANFTKPSAAAPSLLRHDELVTLWHEFGHILHQVLTRAARSRFSGTATERDFVEAPSQMLEHWCWEPEILQSFARHYKTGEPIPAALVERMIAARNLDSGIIYLRQLYFATLDFAYHTPGFDGDSTATARDLHPLVGFPFPPGTHFQSGFGHLFGYDAGYYGYLWSQVFGDDMYERFAPDPLNAEVGSEYRRLILERGGSVDGGGMVREFLGREPRKDAFLREIGLVE